jgi:oxaloacetate decarboxylase gamma subunit
MDSDISTALSLLAIGMTTVFIVLLLVVATGNILIRFVNSISPNNDQLTSAKIAAISGAVEAFTQGQGRITKIEKD